MADHDLATRAARDTVPPSPAGTDDLDSGGVLPPPSTAAATHRDGSGLGMMLPRAQSSSLFEGNPTTQRELLLAALDRAHSQLRDESEQAAAATSRAARCSMAVQRVARDFEYKFVGAHLQSLGTAASEACVAVAELHEYAERVVMAAQASMYSLVRLVPADAQDAARGVERDFADLVRSASTTNQRLAKEGTVQVTTTVGVRAQTAQSRLLQNVASVNAAARAAASALSSFGLPHHENDVGDEKSRDRVSSATTNATSGDQRSPGAVVVDRSDAATQVGRSVWSGTQLRPFAKHRPQPSKAAAATADLGGPVDETHSPDGNVVDPGDDDDDAGDELTAVQAEILRKENALLQAQVRSLLEARQRQQILQQQQPPPSSATAKMPPTIGVPSNARRRVDEGSSGSAVAPRCDSPLPLPTTATATRRDAQSLQAHPSQHRDPDHHHHHHQLTHHHYSLPTAAAGGRQLPAASSAASSALTSPAQRPADRAHQEGGTNSALPPPMPQQHVRVASQPFTTPGRNTRLLDETAPPPRRSTTTTTTAAAVARHTAPQQHQPRGTSRVTAHGTSGTDSGNVTGSATIDAVGALAASLRGVSESRRSLSPESRARIAA